MSSLYEIAEDVQALDDLIESSMVDENGNPREPTPEEQATILAMIAESETAFKEKAERICRFRADLLGDAEKFKAEEARLAKRRKVMENKAAALRMYLDMAMVKIKADKLQVGTFRLRMQNNPKSVVVALPDELPADYWRVIPETKEPNKVKINTDFEVGAYPWGAVVQSRSIRIE